MVLIIAAINFLSAFVQAASGFGYAIFAMFLMPMFLPFQQCSVISAAVIVIIATQMMFSLYKHIGIKKIIIPMFFCLLTTWLGIWIIHVTDEVIMRKIMGVFLILLAIYFYLTKKYGVVIKQTFFSGMIIGVFTGITTGMFNIVGPFLALYYYDNCKDNVEFKANIECSFFIAGLFSLILNLTYTKLDSFLVSTIITSGIAAVLAGVIGLKIFYRINRETLKYIIISILPLMGIIQLLK